MSTFSRPKTTKERKCPNRKCRHIHASGNPCHIFVQEQHNPDDESSEEEESSEESEEEEEEEEDEEEELDSDDEGPPPDLMEMAKGAAKGLAARGKSAAKQAKEAAKRAAREAAKAMLTKLLEQPMWATTAGFKRCNCTVGVPNDDPKFWPVAMERYAGTEVRINQLGEPPEDGWHLWHHRHKPPAPVLGQCFAFVNPRSLARASCACKSWSEEVRLPRVGGLCAAARLDVSP